MNKDTELFLEELKHNSNVLGVILFGSWARGNNRPDSDVDLLVVTKEGFKRTVEYKNNQPFEIIYTTPLQAVEFWKNHRDDCTDLWSVAQVLHDVSGTVSRLQEEAEKIIKEGKKPVEDSQKKQFQFSSEDEIRACRVLAKTDVATAAMVLNDAVFKLTSLFFNLRQLWIPAPKQRLQKIEKINPEFHDLLMKFYKGSISFEEKLDIAEKMIPTIF